MSGFDFETYQDDSLRRAMSAGRRPSDDDIDIDALFGKDPAREQAAQKAHRDAEDAKSEDEVLQAELDADDGRLRESVPDEDGPAPSDEGGQFQSGGSGGSSSGGNDTAAITDDAIVAQNDGNEGDDPPPLISTQDNEAEARRRRERAVRRAEEAERERRDAEAARAAATDDDSDDSDMAASDAGSGDASRPAETTASRLRGISPTAALDSLVGAGIDVQEDSTSQARLPKMLVAALRAIAEPALRQRTIDRGLDPAQKDRQPNQHQVVLCFLLAQLGADVRNASVLEQDLIAVFAGGNPALDSIGRRLEDLQASQDSTAEDLERLGRMSSDQGSSLYALEVGLSFLLAERLAAVNPVNQTPTSVDLVPKAVIQVQQRLTQQAAAARRAQKQREGRPL